MIQYVLKPKKLIYMLPVVKPSENFQSKRYGNQLSHLPDRPIFQIIDFSTVFSTTTTHITPCYLKRGIIALMFVRLGLYEANNSTQFNLIIIIFILRHHSRHYRHHCHHHHHTEIRTHTPFIFSVSFNYAVYYSSLESPFSLFCIIMSKAVNPTLFSLESTDRTLHQIASLSFCLSHTHFIIPAFPYTHFFRVSCTQPL